MDTATPSPSEARLWHAQFAPSEQIAFYPLLKVGWELGIGAGPDPSTCGPELRSLSQETHREFPIRGGGFIFHSSWVPPTASLLLQTQLHLPFYAASNFSSFILNYISNNCVSFRNFLYASTCVLFPLPPVENPGGPQTWSASCRACCLRNQPFNAVPAPHLVSGVASQGCTGKAPPLADLGT